MTVGHSTNLVGLPTSLLASAAFNEHPQALRISGVREMNKNLLEMLSQAEDLDEAGEAFSCYMMAMFGIDPEQRERPRSGAAGTEADGGGETADWRPPASPASKTDACGACGERPAATEDAPGGEGQARMAREERAPRKVRRFRSSYLRLLKGWGYDANSPEGAVLKGWVESRFGLFPTFHKEVIERVSGPGWATYIEEKMSSRFHNNAIYTQLDMLFEFCQWALERFAAPGKAHLTLYRGTNSFDEHQIVERLDKRTVVMRINNLASFSSDRDVAGCFGDVIITAKVPVTKIAFFNTLLPVHPLKGEGEYLVIGGDYRVGADYF